MQDDLMNQKTADLNKENNASNNAGQGTYSNASNADQSTYSNASNTSQSPYSNASNTSQSTYDNVSKQNSYTPGQNHQSTFVNTQSIYGNHQNGYTSPYQQRYQAGQSTAGYAAPAGQNITYYGAMNGAQNNRTSGNAAAQGAAYAGMGAAAGRNYTTASGNAAAGRNYTTASGNAAAGRNYTTASGNAAAGSNYTSVSGNTAANGNYYAGNSAGRFVGNAAAGQADAERNIAEAATKESRKKKKEKKKSEAKDSTFRKVALSAVYGLVFGLIAGLAFFAVKEIGGQMGLTSDTADSIQIAEVPATDNNTLSSDSNNVQTTDSKQQVINSSDVVQTNSSTTFVAVDDVSSVVDKVMPSIVSVINSYTADYYYFSEEEEASGSGIIIGSNDDELLIVTNYHVIQGNDSLKVIFCDEAEAMAQVKGQDKEMDLAVIAIPLEDISSDTKKNISIATMGDSDNLKVGETAIAIGNSLGFGQSVSKGIISAVNREMDMNGVKGTFIQTDAAINPGNSGGALLNINGEVIGINSNKLGGNAVEGMGYAIPITAAKPILEDLMIKETKKLAEDDKQSYLGISGANITSQEQAFYGYPDGIYVANVYEDTAAEQAGLQKGDFIVTFDGEEVSSMEDLQKLLLYYEAGTTVDMEIYRSSPTGYKQMTITVTLGNRNEIKD